MTVSIAYLGPEGTFSEFAATTYAKQLSSDEAELKAYPTITQAISATAQKEVNYCVVPVENSIGGGVTFTLDTLWEVDTLQIQQAFTLPIQHALISTAPDIRQVQTVYSHSQALSQCRDWLGKHLPNAKLVAVSSTTEPLPRLKKEKTAAAIASQWGAQLYKLPILAHPINDYADNYTRFWALGQEGRKEGSFTSLAFSLKSNEPGALLKPLQLFSALNLNMSRIESRPTKRLLGEYIFFVDVESGAQAETMSTALEVLKLHTATLKIFGSYDLVPIDNLL